MKSDKTILLLLLAEFIFVFGSGLYGPIYAIFVQGIGGDIFEVGIAWAIFLIAMATLELPFGRLIDRYGQKAFLAPCYLIAAAAIFGYIFVQDTIQLFFIQLVMGIAFAMGDPAWDAWFSNSIPKGKMGFDWALYHTTTGYGQGAAAIVGGAIAQFIGFNYMFMLGGILAVSSFFIVMLIKRPAGRVGIHIHRHRAIKRRINVMRTKTPAAISRAA